MMSNTAKSDNYISLNRQAARLGYFDFAITLSRQLSSLQIETIKRIFEQHKCRVQLADKKELNYYVLFIAYDNVKEILKYAEKHRILKNTAKSNSKDTNERSEFNTLPKLKLFLKSKAMQQLNPNIIELEQKQVFTVSKRYEFIKRASVTTTPLSNHLEDDEPFEDFIDIFTQSELLRVFWGIILSIEINVDNPDMVKMFNILETDNVSYKSHKFMDVLRRSGMLESVSPLHTDEVQSSLKNIDSISNYYGQNVSIYFQFMRFYIKWLALPAFFGVVRQLVSFISPDASLIVFELDLLYCIMIIIWSTVFIRYWRQKSAENMFEIRKFRERLCCWRLSLRL